MAAKSGIMISIITICYNAESVIEKTMKSVLEQTFTNFEYIIKDGQSTDKTNVIIQEYEKRFKEKGIPFRHIVSADSGIYDAMNQATDVAEGEWLNYMNADDIFWNKFVLEDIFGHGEYNGDILYGDSVCEHEFIRGHKEYTLWRGQHQDFSVTPFSHQACFFRADLIKKYHYNPSYRIAADYDVMLRAKMDNKQFKNINQIVSWCTMDGISNIDIKRSFAETVHIREKYQQEEPFGGNIRFTMFVMGVKYWVLLHLPYILVGRLLRFQMKRKGKRIYQSVKEIAN